ncbi:hypothetical protein, partial [Microbacterium sp.]|uniref:hypothetical protein n=1 Tax=Microbacterium sp. TaxID=51671 RepID=UPI002736EC8C
MSAKATVGTCAQCDATDKLIMPLHGDNGGPLTCIQCGLAWHAKYGRRRKLGRIVTKAIKAFFDAGGAYHDVDRLRLAASGVFFSSWDADTIGADVGDITTELLEATIRLTHPDKHPVERQEAAQRVTQELLALKPFVFPAPKKKPAEPQRNASEVVQCSPAKEPLRIEYPCELCADTVPYFYCNTCKTKWQGIQDKERERERVKRQKQYARRRQLEIFRRGALKCTVCGTEFKGKRKGARYCSAACRQRAHRERVTANELRAGEHVNSRHAECAANTASRRLAHRDDAGEHHHVLDDVQEGA